MENCTLNNATYQVAITLIRRDEGAQSIPIDHVIKLSIVNDSMEPFPRAKIVIKDPSSTVLPTYSPDNRSILAVKIIAQERHGDDVRTISKTHAFNINKVTPLNFAGNNNTYEIDAVSVFINQWMSPIVFSTGVVDNSSVTETACNMLAKAKIPFRRPSKESNYTCPYITDINSPLRDHVNKLLDDASIGGSGFYFPWWDMVNNELAIDSIVNILSNSTSKSYNVLSVASEDYGSSNFFTPTSIEYTNDISATKINSISRGIKEFNFDHLKGEFNEKRILYKDITNGSTYRGFEPVIDNTVNTDADINYTQFASSHNWFADIRNAVRTYNGALITIEGASERNIGDLIIMQSSKTLQNTFAGIWMNMRQIDEYNFGSNKFEQKIVMSRVGKLES